MCDQQKSILIGNWKMNGTRDQLATLIQHFLQQWPKIDDKVGVIFLPPALYIAGIVSALKETNIAVGGQDMSEASVGARTGEIAGSMLKDIGATYVLLGHSERRHFLKESAELVAQKMKAAFQVGLTPIICVGEEVEQPALFSASESFDSMEEIQSQLSPICNAISEIGLGTRRFLLAYEPVWAIGTGKVPSTAHIQKIHSAIRAQLAAVCRPEQFSVLYGGSLNAENARSILTLPEVDGGLVGGASLEAHSFIQICEATLS